MHGGHSPLNGLWLHSQSHTGMGSREAHATGMGWIVGAARESGGRSGQGLSGPASLQRRMRYWGAVSDQIEGWWSLGPLSVFQEPHGTSHQQTQSLRPSLSGWSSSPEKERAGQEAAGR